VPKQQAPERNNLEASKSARTRQRILDAAASVLNRNGYASTRLSDIAELAQVQAPALYYYFASREELIEEVVTLGMTRALTHVSDALAELPADATQLDRICTAVGAHLEVVLRLSDYASAAIRYGPSCRPTCANANSPNNGPTARCGASWSTTRSRPANCTPTWIRDRPGC
jgi:AcrR family transcriptional regulator